MKYEELLRLVGDEPVFSTSILATGVSLPAIRVHLSRWVKAGRLIQLRRGLYMPARPYRKIEPHPFLLANRVMTPSYVSLESALAFHGMIPEHTASIISITTRRPTVFESPVGRFLYRHLSPVRFWGFTREEVASGQYAFVARPEKALLDLIFLTPAGHSPEFLQELRLQNLDKFNAEELNRAVKKMGNNPKLLKAAFELRQIMKADGRKWSNL